MYATGDHTTLQKLFFRGRGLTEGKVIKKVALDFTLTSCVAARSPQRTRQEGQSIAETVRRTTRGWWEVREGESAVCYLQFREDVLRKEKELLSTSPGSTQVKEVAKCSTVAYP